MPFFSYNARSGDGRMLLGLVEAQSESESAALLRERGLFVVNIHPKKTAFSLHDLTAKFSRVHFGDIVDFTRQLSTMISAGLPLTDALSILQVQTGSAAMSKVIAEVLRQIEGGLSFSKGLDKFPNEFSPIYIALVRAGEAAGILDGVLARLADNLEKNREFKGKVMGALLYPILVVIAMGAVITIMMIFVIPKLTALYKDMGVELPLPTKILIGISDFFVNYWYIGILIFVVGGYLIARWRKSLAGRRVLDALAFRIPIFGPLQKKVALVEFTRTFGILIGAGVPVLEALSIVADSMNNVYFKEAMEEVSLKLEKGFTLSEPMSQMSIFPPIVGQMISVGEKTGKLDETLLKLSHYFEVEADQTIKGLTTALEPLIMVVLGVGVGFLVWAIISPIYNLTSKF